VFDGVHLGHQALLDKVETAARSVHGTAVAVTFTRHPLAVLNPARCPEPVSTVEERRALLMAHGIDQVVALDFDASMSRLSARRFLETVLLARYELKTLVVGPDFAMGRDRRGDLAGLRELGAEFGFTVEVVDPVPAAGGKVSSTRLRQALADGEVEVARELLGREYHLSGTVVAGHGRGRTIGFPTANLEVEEDKMLPGDGVYAAFAADGPAAAGATPSPPAGGRPRWRKAVVNIGIAPTFGGDERRVEIHILDFAGDLRGRHLDVCFVGRLRGERRFADAEALRAQIEADVAAARTVLEQSVESNESKAGQG
jgi:riboflavin kinase/FMN adenylyltransferase